MKYEKVLLSDFHYPVSVIYLLIYIKVDNSIVIASRLPHI